MRPSLLPKNATGGLGFKQCDIPGKYKLGVIQVECMSCVWMLRIVTVVHYFLLRKAGYYMEDFGKAGFKEKFCSSNAIMCRLITVFVFFLVNPKHDTSHS